MDHHLVFHILGVIAACNCLYSLAWAVHTANFWQRAEPDPRGQLTLGSILAVSSAALLKFKVRDAHLPRYESTSFVNLSLEGGGAMRFA